MNEIVDVHRISRMNEGIAALRQHVNEWIEAGAIPEVDWSRVRVLEFQDTLRSRDSHAKHLGDKECLKCPEVAEHVRSFILVNRSDSRMCSTKSSTEKKSCMLILHF